MGFQLGPRRGVYIDIVDEVKESGPPLSKEELEHFETFDLIYRSLCAILYNFVPQSGHPGGSISSGRIVAGVLFEAMDYNIGEPNREDADIISYAAGHKALGLYAMWAMRNEIARIANPASLPREEKLQLRLEDLLGFRRNPVNETLLFKKFHSKALDGHPTPATPFVRLSTGASGVGVSTSLGLAFGARDYYGKKAPRVHVIEGEGGLTPGRVAEALASAGSARLDNAIVHLDWNQASIDSNRVCREGEKPGDYVQWDPMELFYLHDWNVIFVPDGKDFQQVIAAQRRALTIDNSQPTAIIYSTIKGWQYGIEGRASHGAGHALCSEGFAKAIESLANASKANFPTCCELEEKRCVGENGANVIEACLWESLKIIRHEMESSTAMVADFARRLGAAKKRLEKAGRKPRRNAPRVDAIYELAEREMNRIPDSLYLDPGSSATLRGQFGKVLNQYNKASEGAIFIAAADLLGSTSVNLSSEGFGEGYFNTVSNPESRTLSVGGICEDAMAGIMSGLGSFGRHIGGASSYAAFIAPLGHIAARLHAIGNQARQEIEKGPYRPMFLICAHAGIKTGEDGPTHADPQPLQILAENFPAGTAITLTPWDPQEIWPLVSAALARRPAVISPFVTRPPEVIPDRETLRLAPATDAVKGLYLLREAKGTADGTVVLQGSGVAMTFALEVLPQLDRNGIDLDVYYVASAELFDALPKEEQKKIFPEEKAVEAMGITGFTLPTMYRWIQSDRGRALTMHPFMKGHFLGSGKAEMVLAEGGLDAKGQLAGIRRYLDQKVAIK
jgi:transketolase